MRTNFMPMELVHTDKVPSAGLWEGQSDEGEMSFSGKWDEHKTPEHFGGTARVTSQADASVSFSFTGNQVRLIGSVDDSGGLAEVHLDQEHERRRVFDDDWLTVVVIESTLVGVDERRVEVRHGVLDFRHGEPVPPKAAQRPRGSRAALDN